MSQGVVGAAGLAEPPGTPPQQKAAAGRAGGGGGGSLSPTQLLLEEEKQRLEQLKRQTEAKALEVQNLAKQKVHHRVPPFWAPAHAAPKR